VVWKSAYPLDSIEISYKVFPLLLENTFYSKDTSLIRKVEDNSGFNPGFAYEVSEIPEGYNSAEGIRKSGYLSRGINVGNAQDLSVNSDLNLQLSGRVTDDLELLASISDANIPIQPGGNSATLQDFDQVYINVFNDRFSLTGGDYQLRSKPSRYLNYFKRAQGANVSYSFNQKSEVTHDLMASAAVSKGKYARNIFTATEGNQGPYRLTGEEGEQFIVVLAGTERVYIDGKLLKRGEEYDYVIDYNAAELVFTPNQPITKDKRIQIEFQYSDKNYARSIFQFSDHITGKNFKAYISAYSEQDAKNQTLQQDLSLENIATLTTAGDNLFSAFIPAIDSTGYTPEGVHYELVDSLGFDSVFVFSTNSELGVYSLGFSNVGAGNGDYIQNGFSANGRVFKWVAPELLDGVLVRQGEFAPFVVLVSPKKQQVLAAGFESKLFKKFSVRSEGSVTNRDNNTFSLLDSEDDFGYSALLGVNFTQDSSLFNSWGLEVDVSSELLSENFSTTERFRKVEFLRNWNLLDLELEAAQFQTQARVNIRNSKRGFLTLQNETFISGNQFNGVKSGLVTDLELGKVHWINSTSYLTTNGDFSSDFYRHKNDLSVAIKSVKVGYQDEFEINTRKEAAESGYEFFDYQVYVQNSDSSRNKSRVFYRKRIDRINEDGSWNIGAVATQVGASYEWLTAKNQKIKLNASRRELVVNSDSLNSQAPENTLIGRLEYSVRAFKNAFTTNLFYQVGSGLEQRREYVYIEVPAGQGVYVWIDYNQDDIRDLNEFEVAAFSYEANFIRSFVPSNTYERVFSNGFNINSNLDLAQAWNNKAGVKKFLSKFNHQFSMSTDRKTASDEPTEHYNPFRNDIDLEALLALNSAVRNTLFYNRLNPRFGADFTLQNNGSKILLSNGLESRGLSLQRLNFRWNLSKSLVSKLAISEEFSQSEASFNSARNFNVRNRKVTSEVTWQPSNNARLKILGAFSDKFNALEGDEDTAELLDFGAEARLSEPGKGALDLKANIIRVLYSGVVNTPLAFEMLEGLNTGTNFTWNMQWQQNLSKTVQLTIGYFGRKSEENPFIHSGTMQVRALF